MISNNILSALLSRGIGAVILAITLAVSWAYFSPQTPADRYVVTDAFAEVPILVGIYISQEPQPRDRHQVSVIRAGLVFKEPIDYVNTRARSLADTNTESIDGKTVFVVLDPTQASDAPSYGQPFPEQKAYLVHTKRQRWNRRPAASAPETQKQIVGAVNRMSWASAFNTLNRMEAKVDQLEAAGEREDLNGPQVLENSFRDSKNGRAAPT